LWSFLNGFANARKSRRRHLLEKKTCAAAASRGILAFALLWGVTTTAEHGDIGDMNAEDARRNFQERQAAFRKEKQHLDKLSVDKVQDRLDGAYGCR